MASIGRWGPIIHFRVNSKKILNFEKFKKTSTAIWTEHKMPNGKPKQEYIGNDTPEVTMEVILSAHRGVKPRKMLRELSAACHRGEIRYLFINGKKVGKNKYYLKKMSSTWDEIWDHGELVSAKVNLTLEEYR